MPPSTPGLEHVVLSTYAAHILSSIKRVHPQVIPNCEDFDKCFKVALVRNLQALKLEIRKSVRGIRNSIGGSHSEFPFG